MLYTYEYIYTHTYTHTYINTYIPIYIYKHVYVQSRIHTYIIRCNDPQFLLYLSKTYTKYVTNYNTMHFKLSAAVYNRHTHVLC